MEFYKLCVEFLKMSTTTLSMGTSPIVDLKKSSWTVVELTELKAGSSSSSFLNRIGCSGLVREMNLSSVLCACDSNSETPGRLWFEWNRSMRRRQVNSVLSSSSMLIRAMISSKILMLRTVSSDWRFDAATRLEMSDKLRK